MFGPRIELPDLERGAEAFAPYDATDVAAAIGALQLLPGTGCHLGRLEAAASIAASQQPERGLPQISHGRLRSTLNGAPFSDALAVGDPRYDDVLTEELGFHGGSYLVSSGLASEAVFTIEHLLVAMYFHAGPRPAEFLAEVQPLIGATLTLSDRVLRAAGLDRHEPPHDDPTEPLALPPRARLEELKDIVTFDEGELPADLLGPLIQEQGTQELVADEGLGVPVLAKPILRSGDQFVVVLPLGLLNALRHALLVAAERYGFADELSRRFREAVAATVTESLERLGMDAVEPARPKMEDLPAIEEVFQFDDDKVLVVQVVTDELAGYDASVVHGFWSPRGLSEKLEERRREVERQLLDSGDVDEVMHLLVFESAGGRAIGLGLGDTRERRLLQQGMSAAELQSLSVIEMGEPLALYKFAKDRAKLERGEDFLSVVDRLDAYQLYRDSGYTLRLDYSGEDLLKPLEYVGSGIAIRYEAKTTRDPHFVRYQPGRSAQVVRFEEDEPPAPLYRFRHWQAKDEFWLLVDGLPLPVWLVGTSIKAQQFEQFKLQGHVIHMLAFWLWQMSGDIAGLLGASASRLVTHIHVDTSEGPLITDDVDEQSTDYGTVQASDRGIELRVGPAAFRAFWQEDNAGERAVVRLLLVGFREAAQRDGVRAGPSDAQIDAWLEKHFNNPRKKHLLLLDASRDLRGVGEGLRPYRPIQSADVQIVRAELGAYLHDSLKVDKGDIPKSRRVEVLACARDWCLAEIEKAVAELSPEGLLERVMALNETMAFRRFQQRLKIPTRMACYETEPETQDRLRQEVPELAATSIACRFLVEYVAAVPPSGSRRVSTAVTDGLIALAAELQDRAQALDAADNGFSDAAYALSARSRLTRTSPDDFRAGQLRYLGAHVDAEIADAEDTFGDHWGERPAGPPPLRRDQLNAVMPYECGLSLDELEQLLTSLARQGLDRKQTPMVVQLPTVRSELSEELGWSPDKVERGIDFFSLRPRGSFYSDADPPGWSKSDVQPWRFYRRLSYNRRPLVIRAASEHEELLWGFRHVWEAWPLFYSTLVDARFRAESRELQSLLGRLANARGRDLEDKVADLYERYPRFEVLRRRDKLGGQRVVDPDGNKLGDVDVLVAEPARKRLLAVDAKDLSGTLTPSDLRRAWEKTFGTGGRKRTFMDKHLRRLDWLRSHRAEALTEFGLPVDEADRWSVDGLMVTDHVVVAPFVRKTALPVTAYRALEKELAAKPKKPQKRRQKGRRKKRRR
jgi:hypothetical protein